MDPRLERDYFGVHEEEEIPSNDPPRFKAEDLTREEFDKLGLNSHLSSQRSNGLKSMIDQIKIFVNT